MNAHPSITAPGGLSPAPGRRRSRRLMRATLAGAVAIAGLVLAAGPALAKKDKPEPAVRGEVLLQLDNESLLQPLMVRHRLSLISRFGNRPIYRLKVVGNGDAKREVEALRRENGVRAVELNTVHEGPQPRRNVPWAISSPRPDPSNPWGTQPPNPLTGQWAMAEINLAAAQALSNGRGVRVAVLDTGVDRQHPALAGRLMPGWDFVDGDADPSEGSNLGSPSWGHGTHVAGLVALVAPQARIMPLRILDNDGMGNTWVLAEAMLHAVDPDGNPDTDDGAHVINLSLSTLTETALFKTVSKLVGCNKPKGKGKDDKKDKDKDKDKDKGKGKGKGSAVEEDDEDSPDPLASRSDKQRCKGFGGAVVVAAAGNRGSDKVEEFPAAEKSPGLLSVAASAPGGRLSSFTNYGWVKLAAPGQDVASSVPGSLYATWSGTSMAAPLVSAGAALVLSRFPDLTVDEVAKRLVDTAQKLCRGPMRELDLLAALQDKDEKGKGGKDKGSKDKDGCDK